MCFYIPYFEDVKRLKNRTVMKTEQKQIAGFKEFLFSKDEVLIIRDALTEYWHNNMKLANDSKFKKIAEVLKDEFKDYALSMKQ